MARLSIVIPCLGDAAEFDGTLVSVLQNRPTDCEIFVVHRQPYDDPYELAGEVDFLHEEADSLTELINAALPYTSGEILHILGCGLEVTENWTAPALVHFADPDVASVSPLVFDSEQRLVSAGVKCSLGGARQVAAHRRLAEAGSGRLRAKILGPTLLASFLRRDCVVALDGLETAMTDCAADLALALALRELGKLHVVEPASRLSQTALPRVQSPSTLRRAQALERLYWRTAGHHSLSLTLPLHVVHVAADCAAHLAALRLLPALLGRALACCEMQASRRYAEQLERARERLENIVLLESSQVKTPRLHIPPAETRRKAA